jgi:hypothetical protein
MSVWYPYQQVAPSGVTVLSAVPFTPKHWNQNPVLHLFWSYTSWLTLVIGGRPRKFFEQHMCHNPNKPDPWRFSLDH